MTTNQAFKILSNIAGPHVARIITDAMPNMGCLQLFRVSCALRRGVPVAKIIHNKWFYGLKFYTNKHTLDPRPDTETLVDAVLTDYAGAKNFTIADIGTGTGCIICAIAKNAPATGIAIDKSRAALRVARKNVCELGLGDKISVRHGDFNRVSALPEKSVDVIVSNPPYIAHGDTRVDTGAMHDPKMALFAKNNGTAAYMAIAKNGKQWIRDNGRIYVEIGIGMEHDVKKIFEDAGWRFIKHATDLGDVIRVLCFGMK